MAESLVEVHRCQPWLGTYVRIRARALDALTAQQACTTAFKRIADIHTKMSFHDPQSDVARLNREAHRHPTPVSMDTWRVLERALHLSNVSDGIFDITVAPVLQKWGYLPLIGQAHPGSFEGDYRNIDLLADRFVSFRKRLRIDLGGIAKGFAVDEAVKVLMENGVTEGSVNAGGDLRIFGGREEPIYIKHPRCPGGRLIPVAKIKDGAFATSADYYKARLEERQRVNPIVNPKTQTPGPPYQSVSVSAPSCMTADALTKIVSLMGEKSESILGRFKARAIIVKPIHV